MNNDITFSTDAVRDMDRTMWKHRSIPNPVWGVGNQEIGIGFLEEQEVNSERISRQEGVR